MNKKNLVIKLLLNPRVLRSAIRLLKSPHVRRFIVKQVTRQFGRR